METAEQGPCGYTYRWPSAPKFTGTDDLAYHASVTGHWVVTYETSQGGGRDAEPDRPDDVVQLPGSGDPDSEGGWEWLTRRRVNGWGWPARSWARGRGCGCGRSARRRALFGLFLVAVCVVAVLVIYTRIGDRQDVLAVSRTVLAGEQLTDADLRVVSISADDSFPSVPATARASIVGQYAKVRMVDGSLLVADSVQARPLVDPSKVLMSVPVPLSGVPTGLREGSRLVLVVTPEAGAARRRRCSSRRRWRRCLATWASWCRRR